MGSLKSLYRHRKLGEGIAIPQKKNPYRGFKYGELVQPIGNGYTELDTRARIYKGVFNPYTTKYKSFVVEYNIDSYIGKTFTLKSTLARPRETYGASSGCHIYLIKAELKDGSTYYLGTGTTALKKTVTLGIDASQIQSLWLYISGCFNYKYDGQPPETSYRGIKTFTASITANGITEQLFPYLD